MKSFVDIKQEKGAKHANRNIHPIKSAASTITDNRSNSIAQRKFIEAIDASPKQAIQRQKINSLIGNTVQMKSFGEEELQMRTDNQILQEKDLESEDKLNKSCNTSNAPIQRMGTLSTDSLANATPKYLRELSNLYAPGMWDYTNAGAFAVTHKGRKNALGMSDVNYSPAILKTTTRKNWLGFDTKHFSKIIDLSNPKLSTDLYGRDCADAAEYLMHYNRGEDLSLSDPDNPVNPLHATRGQAEKTTDTNADYDPVSQRPYVLPTDLPAGVKDANAQADIGEAYCIVSEPNSGKYNFHYGTVAAKKGAEVLTVEGFATSSVLTTPDWSFNVYDSASTFHQVWQQGMTKSTPPFAPGYPFTFVAKLV